MPYKTMNRSDKTTRRHIHDHKRPHPAIQGHIRPYKAIQGHNRQFNTIIFATKDNTLPT